MDRLDGQNLKPRSGDLGGSAAIYPSAHSLRCGVSLAPIAGFTNAACRLMATHGGADLTYTEFLRLIDTYSLFYLVFLCSKTGVGTYTNEKDNCNTLSA